MWAGVGYVLVPIVFALIAWLTHAAATLVEQHFLTGHPTLARLHSAWCLYLSVNITLHYLVSIFTRPATVQPSPAVLLGWRDPAAVPSGHYAGYRYCSKCRFFKPPDAHHCSSCGHCVRGMDHHCPFVANCVGSKTMRPFLLFVFWAAVGTGWSGAVCLAALATDPWGAVDSLSQHSLARTFRAQYGRSSAFVHLGHGPGPSGFAAAVARMLFVVPTHIGVVLSAWGMMAILGGVFGIVLSGMLLSLGLSTLSLAIRGTSLISNLQVSEHCDVSRAPARPGPSAGDAYGGDRAHRATRRRSAVHSTATGGATAAQGCLTQRRVPTCAPCLGLAGGGAGCSCPGSAHCRQH